MRLCALKGSHPNRGAVPNGVATPGMLGKLRMRSSTNRLLAKSPIPNASRYPASCDAMPYTYYRS